MLPASGTVSSTDPQTLIPSTPLRLPDAGNASGITPVSTGLRIEAPGTYRLSYTVKIVPSDPAVPPTARLFLTLNTPDSAINGTTVSVHHPTGQVEVASEVAMVTLAHGNLIQIVPLEVIGQLCVAAATLTVEQLP
ncbi:hypothetical protein AB0M22_21215 [Nocardia sp. NPDC051756]|uniref:hypothetical protein n=1 Tax=Nocardia sp. NPDC051756 TaxID=3154751 RepID=UPI003432DBDC